MKKIKPSISIMGCGWLGLPLGENLAQMGYQVSGSTTNQSKLSIILEKNIKPYHLNFTPYAGANISLDFFDSKILIINIPPDRRVGIMGFYITQIQEIVNFAKAGKTSKIIFISSTSVYGEPNRDVYEEDEVVPVSEAGRALVETEKFLLSLSGLNSTIIRFGGLIGNDRNPVKFFMGKTNLPNGRAPVNLIYLDDCIGIIKSVIEREAWGEIFNACAEYHPEKQNYYTEVAKKMNLTVPVFLNELLSFKIIRSNKCKNQLNYIFKYPDPLEFPLD